MVYPNLLTFENYMTRAETKETDGNGDEQTFDSSSSDSKYLNTPDLYVFDTSTD